MGSVRPSQTQGESILCLVSRLKTFKRKLLGPFMKSPSLQSIHDNPTKRARVSMIHVLVLLPGPSFLTLKQQRFIMSDAVKGRDRTHLFPRDYINQLYQVHLDVALQCFQSIGLYIDTTLYLPLMRSPLI